MNKATALLVLSAAIVFDASAFYCAAAEPEELPAAHDGRIITYRRIPINETLPQLGARLYDKVDYELQLRRLDAEIKLAKAHLETRRERTSVYDKHFGRTPALFLTRQNAHLAVLEGELRLKELRKEKQLLLRHRKDKVRYRRLALEQGEVEVQVMPDVLAAPR